MNELTKFLVEGILNETAEKAVALFGGGFKPPTKGHLDVVNQGIKQNPEISEVKILVGGGERNGFTQDQAVKIWNLYNDVGFIDKPATVIPVSSPFTYYKNYLKDNPDDKVYVFIGSRPGEEKDQFDVKQRSEFVKKYSDNVVPVEVATGGGVSGTLARKLFKTDIDGFKNMFPENLLDQDFDKILDILNNKSTDNTRKSTPKATEPLTPQNENLILERIKITPNEASNLKLVLNQYKKILKKSTINDLNTGTISLGTMPFKSADSMPGLDSGTVEFLLDYGPYPEDLKNSSGWYISNNTQSLDDDTITVNASTFLPAYSDIKAAVFSKVTGETPDQMLMDTLKHELIHAKDPGVNQGYLDEPYDNKDERLYYGSWTEFPTQTGEFLEAISTHAEEKLKSNPNDKEIQIFEKVLQNILDVFAGKEKQWLPQTVNFINKGSKNNVIKSFIKNVINTAGDIANRNTVPQWDSMRTLDRYLFKLGKIKRYNPEGYREFLTNLYKEIKGIEEMTNFYLKERAKELGQTKFNQIYVGGTGKLNEGDPKKGTGKKPKGSKRRLYTDEDPKDTVGIKFSTRQDIVDTLNKKSFKAKSHARQSQIINLIHQRVRAALGRTKDPAKKKKLKSGFEYIKGKKETSKKKTQRLKKQKLKENQMSMDDFNLVGAVLRDKTKAEEIHNLLLQMFPKQKELLDYNYKNDSYAEFKRVIFHIDKYNIEGPKLIQHTKLKLDPEVYKERDRKYKEYAKGKIKKYFRDSDSDPRTLDLSKVPPITIDSTGEVADGNHRAFLAIKQQKPLRAYQIVDAKNDHPNVEKILNIVGRKKQEENIDPKSQAKHKGKAAPFGSAYEPVNEELIEENISDIKNWVKNSLKSLGEKSISVIAKLGKEIADIFNIDVDRPKWSYDYIEILEMLEEYYDDNNANWPYDDDEIYALAIRMAKQNDNERKKLLQQGKITQKDIDYWNDELEKTPSDRNLGYDIQKRGTLGSPLSQMDNLKNRDKLFSLTENATYSSKIDYKQQIKDLTKHMIKKGMNILPLPRVIFKHGDQENASQFLGKTAYYSPSDMTVVLYTEGRHPKDIVRSFAHEMVHHIQNLEGRLGGINTTNTQEDDNLNDIEREAYTKGNMTFRNWTDSLDGEEVTSLNEKIVGEKIECDSCGWSWNIVDGGDDLYICHKCGHDNEPKNGDPFGLKAYARELMEDFNIEDVKPPTKSLEKPKEVRIFNPNCGCDKT